jgi:fatty-acyl-CoA synthase
VRPVDYIDKAAARYGSRVALVDGATRYSYADLRSVSVRVARALGDTGLRTGDRVAAYCGNDPKVLLALCGVMRAGGVWAPLNPGRVADDENTAYLRLIEPTHLVYQDRYAGLVAGIRQQVPSLRVTVCLDNDSADQPFSRMLASGNADPADGDDWADARGNPGALVGIFQTGGSTGAPKAVMWDVLSFGRGIEALQASLDHDDESPICLNTMPLAHGAISFAFAMLTLGATQYIRPFSVEDVLHHLTGEGITHLLLAPSGVYALLASPVAAAGSYPALRCLKVSSAAIAPEKLKRAVEVFGECVSTAYGQMETLMVSSLHKTVVAEAARGVHPRRLHSCGRIVDSVMVGFMNEDGQLLSEGEGEIVVRGRGVSPGYFKDPAATAHARRGGWHHTGDVGYLDEDGFLYITGRIRDIIICGGYNIYAADVENAIMAMDDVRECAAVGIGDEKFGEVVAAVVVWNGATAPAPGDVVTHCLSRLSSMAVPRRVEFWPELPRTPLGKVDKMAIRRSLAG